MASFEREHIQIDSIRGDLARGLMYQVAGWVLLAFNGIPVIFIWTGWRAGSNFWFYWTVIESVIGLALVMVGNYYKSRAGAEILRPREHERAA